MFGCPNCGNNIKYDIASQKMKCPSCDSMYEPEEITRDTDIVQGEFFETKSYTCPQCGGNIISEDSEAAVFCSYCGASGILTEKLTNARRPQYIIPFKIDKEQCKDAYKKMLKKSLFAPTEIKNDSVVDSFRGIYMPYWSYSMQQSGDFCLKGKKSYRRGDYIITDHYNLTGDVEGSYEGITYDASSNFSDELSMGIAPYNVRDEKPFTPSYLSGFYADVADVPEYVYENDAVSIANNEAFRKASSNPEFRHYNISGANSASDIASFAHTRCNPGVSMMLPVWFLSYRSGDRVAYATVNGQTGKVAGDVPVSSKKYFLGSLLLAIPIYILLNFLFVPKPAEMLVWAILFATLASIFYKMEISSISKRESGADDRGLRYQADGKTIMPLGAAGAANAPKPKKKLSTAMIMIIIYGAVMGFSFVTSIGSAIMTSIFPRMSGKSMLGVVIAIAGIIVAVSTVYDCRKYQVQSHKGILGCIFANGISIIVLFINPAADIIFYSLGILAIVSIIFSVVDIVNYHNILCTRPLPQFNRHGGDDNA